jgi:hypothetical protein
VPPRPRRCCPGYRDSRHGRAFRAQCGRLARSAHGDIVASYANRRGSAPSVDGGEHNHRMQALTAFLSAAVTLVGVYLGAHLSGREQRRLARLTQTQEVVRQRQLAYADLLTAYRRYRTFVATEAPSVEVVGATPHGGGVPVVQGAGPYDQAIQQATALVHLLAGDASPVVKAVTKMYQTSGDVARARADCGRGDVPYPVMERARQAEIAFVRVAHSELSELRD